ncbi:GntR family transcriptional regulator [Epibacterium ulvae]|uniref:GntR family transcriptional regulator n=1 Tax=Epibacterium ulvae TaxID=1156985 RepID=UPI00249290DF|nr:GntR family transcriptional regulator [Epibacterium ulvae]
MTKAEVIDLRTTDLSNKIALCIAQEILSGALKAGSHIGTQTIANNYQVSRTPVRDALIALEQAKVLERIPNRGYFVPEQIDRSFIQEFTEDQGTDASVYQQFAEDWLTDVLPEIVTEQSLRQKYSLTKSGTQELLSRATREGWAEPKDGYGWKLLPVAKTAEAFDEIYRFRMAIEPAAMLEPSFEVNRKVLDELKRTQAAMLEKDISETPGEVLLLNGSDFHEELIRLSGNPFFLMALQRVNRMRRLMEYRAEINRERIVEQCSEHLEIINLLERGEIVDASYLMRRHLSGALKRKSPIAWNWSAQNKEENQIDRKN